MKNEKLNRLQISEEVKNVVRDILGDVKELKVGDKMTIDVNEKYNTTLITNVLNMVYSDYTNECVSFLSLCNNNKIEISVIKRDEEMEEFFNTL